MAGQKPGRPFRFDASWVAVVGWVTRHTPRDFGFLRSRWACEAVVLLMLRTHHVESGRVDLPPQLRVKNPDQCLRNFVNQADWDEQAVWRR